MGDGAPALKRVEADLAAGLSVGIAGSPEEGFPSTADGFDSRGLHTFLISAIRSGAKGGSRLAED